MNPKDQLTTLKGIGPRRGEILGRMGLFLLEDLLFYAPRDYRDYSVAKPVSTLAHGQEAAVRLTALAAPGLARIRRGLSVGTLRAEDEAGGRILLCWYNQPYRQGTVRAGETFVACGRVDRSRGIKLTNPALYPELPGILPVYALSKGLPQAQMRQTVKLALCACMPELRDGMPEALSARYRLCELGFALYNLHFPQSLDALQKARRRLAFEDMLLFRLMMHSFREQKVRPRGRRYILGGARAAYESLLPFVPTGAQQKAMADIERDLCGRRAMNRLVMGDVGSGKTAVAAYALYLAARSGFQAAMLAPTELLARQHYDALKAIFGEKELCLLTGSTRGAQRRQALEDLACGRAKIAVGTHALFQAGVEFFDLGLVVADEQHRFGVVQRAAMAAKGAAPDLLVMSATPIPRTLALMFYGDLDLSQMDELPPGRRPVITKLVPENKREDLYRFLEDRAAKKEQAYVVCPLVEPSESLEELKSATEVFKMLRARRGAKIGLLHGQMKEEEKRAAAEAFREGSVDLLVATTVVEVGVDVPNATAIVIENAERFGLSQLHQLRGRVGRGEKESYCFLLTGEASGSASERLKILCSTRDGFAIAKEDLALRGPGEFLGKHQHGLTGFAAMKLAMDLGVLDEAQAAAELVRSGAVSAPELLWRAEEKRRMLEEEIAVN